MICQRCGYCCVAYDVIVPIVVGTSVRAQFKPCAKQCPNLSFEGEKASCKMHDLPLFEHSPCWSHNNAEADLDAAMWKGQPCRLGVHCLKAKTVFDEPKAEVLEDLGPWPEPVS